MVIKIGLLWRKKQHFKISFRDGVGWKVRGGELKGKMWQRTCVSRLEFGAEVGTHGLLVVVRGILRKCTRLRQTFQIRSKKWNSAALNLQSLVLWLFGLWFFGSLVLWFFGFLIFALFLWFRSGSFGVQWGFDFYDFVRAVGLE